MESAEPMWPTFARLRLLEDDSPDPASFDTALTHALFPMFFIVASGRDSVKQGRDAAGGTDRPRARSQVGGSRRKIRPAGTSRRSVRRPDGQTTVTLSADARSPSPKKRLLEPEERNE